MYHTCAVRTDGTLWCWGRNSDGELGIGPGASKNTPAQVGKATDWSLVSSGGYSTYHSCAVKTTGTLWCWGGNTSGQLGDGTRISRDTPTQVGSATNWSDVAPGSNHTCAVRTDGTLWCWGTNHNGQLGDGTGWMEAPTQVAP
jgi:alpha-tubulin suppressor-like RCC1 family protein